MRGFLVLFFFMTTSVWVWSDPPEIDSASPDQAWMITARWVKGGTGIDDGYDWDLRNVRTGKIYFHMDKIPDSEFLPKRFDVLWSSDSHYAALTLYYGRAMQELAVICLSGTKPQDLGLPWEHLKKTAPEKTLVRSEDLRLFDGYNRLLTGADHWVNNTDLSVEIDMFAFLKDKKSGEKYILDTECHRIVRFDGKSGKIVESVCDRYDKKPDPN